MDTENKPNTELLPPKRIGVETAFSPYPVHRLARKGTIDINICEDDGRGGESRWEVDYSKKYGQPGPLAYKLDTLIINRRIEEAKRPVPRLLKLGSLKEICRELGLAETGGNTNQIRNSLSQNALAGITAKTRYRLSDGTERTIDSVFTRYSVIFTGEQLPNGHKADAVYILLNDIFVQVINGAMTRPLDYDYLKSLPPAPQRFYEILSYQIYAALKYDRPRAKLTYSDLCSHAPQTRHTDWNKVRSQMHKVHRPHRESGYIASVNFNETIDKDGKPDWIMCYQPGPKARAEYRAFAKRGGPSVLEMEPFENTPLLPAPAVPELERELIQRGVSTATAHDLATRHAEEKIRLQIEILDSLSKKKREKIDDPAAYLVAAIENDYATPKGFVSQAEQERRDQARQAKDRQDAESRHQKRLADVKERELAAKVASYVKSRSPSQLAQLEAEAIAQASDQTRQSLGEPHMKPFRKTQMTVLVREHVARLIEEGSLAVLEQ